MTELNSSNIAAVEKDGEDLIVTFRKGGTYRYQGAAHHYDDLVQADSPGRYLQANIKGRYEHERAG
jgi:hypothetical protein